jgi:hypothetical protein
VSPEARAGATTLNTFHCAGRLEQISFIFFALLIATTFLF